MEQIPNWLTDAVIAAGMTTVYAEDLDGAAKGSSSPKEGSVLIDPAIPPLH